MNGFGAIFKNKNIRKMFFFSLSLSPSIEKYKNEKKLKLVLKKRHEKGGPPYLSPRLYREKGEVGWRKEEGIGLVQSL